MHLDTMIVIKFGINNALCCQEQTSFLTRPLMRVLKMKSRHGHWIGQVKSSWEYPDGDRKAAHTQNKDQPCAVARSTAYIHRLCVK